MYDRSLKKQWLGVGLYFRWFRFLNSCNTIGVIRATSSVCVRTAMVGSALAWKGYLFIRWATSRKVSPEVHRDRDAICSTCDANDGGYCKDCGCPKWHFSKLQIKNSRERHNCPRGLHPGSVMIPLPVIEAPAQQKKAPCVGCGSNGVQPDSRLNSYQVV